MQSLPLHCAFRKISRQIGETFLGTEISDLHNSVSGEVVQETPIKKM